MTDSNEPDVYTGPDHLDNQVCWCGDDHTWLDHETDPQKTI